MFIAHQLKQQNIVEYVLYMWQIEDLIRALDMDIDRINTQIVQPYPIDDAQKVQLYDWYESLIEMMKREGCQEHGHLQMVRNTVNDINEMHLFLLQNGNDAAYRAKFYFILPSLTFLKSKSSDPAGMSDIEMALIFMYGIMQLRRQSKEISDDTARTLDEIRKWMILVAADYKKWTADQFEVE